MALLALVVFCFVSSAGSLRRVTPLDGQFLPHLAPDPVTMNTVAERNMSWEKPGQAVDSHDGRDSPSSLWSSSREQSEGAHETEEAKELKLKDEAKHEHLRAVILVFAAACFVLWCVGASWPLQIFVFYVGLNSLVAMMAHATKGGSYNSGMVVLNCLLLKMAISLGLWRAYEGRASGFVQLPAELWKYRSVVLSYSFPAGCYAIADVLRIQILRETTPGTYAVLFNLRIIFLIPCWQFLMDRQLLPVHWVSLMAIMLGVIAKESYNFVAGSADYFVYSEILLLGCLSACAGVWNEKLLQHNPGAGVNLQNLAMYSWGLVFVFLITCMWSVVDPSRAISPFAAQSWRAIWGNYMVVAMVIVFATFGCATGYFLRHLTNIAREVALGAFMVVCMAMDIFLFKHGMMMSEIVGGSLVLFGIVLFGFYPVVAVPRADASKSEKGKSDPEAIAKPA